MTGAAHDPDLVAGRRGRGFEPELSIPTSLTRKRSSGSLTCCQGRSGSSMRCESMPFTAVQRSIATMVASSDGDARATPLRSARPEYGRHGTHFTSTPPKRAGPTDRADHLGTGRRTKRRPLHYGQGLSWSG
jgi:hypothetical protein